MQIAVTIVLATLTGLLLCEGAHAQEAVLPSCNPDALFHSTDPRLDANKQVVYHILKDLLEAGHWELADKYLTKRYIQHNPNFPSGRANVAALFSKLGKPKAIARKLRSKVVAVVAEGDFVVVANALEMPDPGHAGKSYTTTEFDMWRIQGGKGDEHWDGAVLGLKALPGIPWDRPDACGRTVSARTNGK